MFLSSLRWVHLVGILGMVFVVLCAGCTGDDGTNGSDGAQGPTGPSGTATCMECHTDTWDTENYLATYVTEFASSLHATGDTYVRKSSSCAPCHTTEGFQVIADGGELTEDLAQSSHIGCFACHAPHTSEDFSLRTSAAVALNSGGTFDKGASNICANCHQGRPIDPAVDSTDPIESKRWGAHHGPQANIVAGQGLWEIAGESYSSTHQHNSGIANGCVGCHMSDLPGSGMAGGHSFAVNYDYYGDNINGSGCYSCHGEDFDATEYTEETKAEFDVKLDELKVLLMAQGWIDENNYVLTDNAPTDSDDRGAVLNYNMLREDRSGGIHNPRYANEAIDAAIVYMTGK